MQVTQPVLTFGRLARGFFACDCSLVDPVSLIFSIPLFHLILDQSRQGHRVQNRIASIQFQWIHQKYLTDSLQPTAEMGPLNIQLSNTSPRRMSRKATKIDTPYGCGGRTGQPYHSQAARIPSPPHTDVPYAIYSLMKNTKITRLHEKWTRPNKSTKSL